MWCVVEGERDEVLASIADGAIDVTITDPPYNERTHASCKTLRGHNAEHVDLGFAELNGFDFVAEMARVTRRWHIAFCALEDLGAYQSAAGSSWVRAGVWHKPDGTPRLMADRPAQGAEGIAIMHRPGKRTAWNGGGSRAHWTCGVERSDRSHPTQKPIRLMRELVRLFSNEDEVIADWHAGSGTTGVAAIVEGRRAILVERDPRHAQTCRDRCIEAETGVDWRKPGQSWLFDDAAVKKKGRKKAAK